MAAAFTGQTAAASNKLGSTTSAESPAGHWLAAEYAASAPDIACSTRLSFEFVQAQATSQPESHPPLRQPSPNDGTNRLKISPLRSRHQLRRPAQWNDDFDHAAHVLLTGERDGYYADNADAPTRHLGRCIAEGFAYQGESSIFRDNAFHGEPSGELPPTAFVDLLQNHDQAGN